MVTNSRELNPVGLVSIWCDHPSHSKTLAVTRFYPAHGRWIEWNGKASQDTSEDALVDNEQFNRERHLGREVRYRSRIECRKYAQCKQAVPVRQEKLDALLDKLAEAGLRDVSLSALAARLGSITT